ncbi:hypothetical protein [Nostoc sp.]|uniref:hypothetical protein n=1 Tax=Nostoc sp. TaxID=1180 RepID=UPI002FF61757
MSQRVAGVPPVVATGVASLLLTPVQTRLMSQRVAGVPPIVATGVASLLLTPI